MKMAHLPLKIEYDSQYTTKNTSFNQYLVEETNRLPFCEQQLDIVIGTNSFPYAKRYMISKFPM